MACAYVGAKLGSCLAMRYDFHAPENPDIRGDARFVVRLRVRFSIRRVLL